MKTIKVGIMPQDKIRERVLMIAKGTYHVSDLEPKIWFTSMRSLAEVLSDDNRTLLHTISEQNPESIHALAIMSGRQESNLSRTLKTLASYNIVDLVKEGKQIRPIAKGTTFEIVAA